MPNYEYLDAVGQVIERLVPIAERDKQIGLKRITVPRKINMGFKTEAPWTNHKENMRKSFKAQEEKGWNMEWSKEQVKQIHGL